MTAIKAWEYALWALVLAMGVALCATLAQAGGMSDSGGTTTVVEGTATGDVTAVGSCLTGDCFQNETANFGFFTSLSSSQAVFRAVVDADIPNVLTIGAGSTVADSALSANVSLLGQTISAAELSFNTVDILVTNTFEEWRTLIGVTGTPDGTKFIRDDGTFQLVGGATITGDSTGLLARSGPNAATEIAGSTYDGTTLTIPAVFNFPCTPGSEACEQILTCNAAIALTVPAGGEGNFHCDASGFLRWKKPGDPTAGYAMLRDEPYTESIDLLRDNITVDGFFCGYTNALVAATHKANSVLCADSDTSILTYWILMPDNWDGGAVVLKATAIDVGFETGDKLAFDLSAQCRTSSQVVDTTFGSTVNLDFTFAAPTENAPIVQTAAVTGGGGTCAGGGILLLRLVVDTSNTFVGSTNDLHYGIAGKLEYTATQRSE